MFISAAVQMRVHESSMRFGLVAGIAATALLTACGERNKYQPPPPAEVSVAKPEQRKVTLYMEVTGNTAPFNHVDLVARVQGFLDKVGYKDGAAVKKGDLLFQIDKAGLRDRACRSRRRRKQQQEALLVQADADLKRKQDLVKTSAVSVAQVDEFRAKRDSTLAALAAGQGPGGAGAAQSRLHDHRRAVRRHRLGAARRSRRHGRRRRADQARDHRAGHADLRQVQHRRAAGAVDPRAACASPASP